MSLTETAGSMAMGAMGTLALETGGETACVAAVHDGAPLSTAVEHRIPGPRPDAARHLLLTIDAVLREAGLGKGAVKTFLFGAGPGSFTGLRVGAAAARALAFASGGAVAAYPSTAAMAVDAFALDPRASRVAVVLDALRGELAFALYERSDAAPRELVAPRLTTPAELLASTDVDVVLASPQRARVLELLGAARSVMAVEPSALPLLALHRAGFARLPRAVPLYLRASAAEEKARAKSQGNP